MTDAGGALLLEENSALRESLEKLRHAYAKCQARCDLCTKANDEAQALLVEEQTKRAQYAKVALALAAVCEDIAVGNTADDLALRARAAFAEHERVRLL